MLLFCPTLNKVLLKQKERKKMIVGIGAPSGWPNLQPLVVPFAGGERSAAAAGRALPVPAQRLAGVRHHPLRRPAGRSRLRQHLLLHQQGGQAHRITSQIHNF